MRPLEPIYDALFALAQNANTTQTPFTIMSRRWIAWDQMSAEQSPALFQMQGMPKVEGAVRGLPVFRLPVDWYVYLSTDPTDLNTPTSPPLNNYLTALINAVLPKIQGQKQTLGGLVESVYIDGEIVLDEGVITSPAVIKIPLVILTGM
jgi:hypothetical protein